MNPLHAFPLAALLSCAAISTAHAQDFRLGGGYTGSNVREAGEEQWIGRAGYQFGADLVLGRQWFVKPGIYLQVRNLNYSLAGTNEDGSPTGTDVEFRYTSRALRVPLMLGRRLLDPSDSPAVNIYIMGGPTALFGLTADLDNDELDAETKAAQWYLGFGGGAEISFIYLEAGYDVAMSNVFEGDAFDTNPMVNNLYLSAGVRLRLAQ